VYGFRLIFAAWALCAAAPPLSFVPQRPIFAPAAGEYRRLWESDGVRIAAALEAASGLRFRADPIEAIVNDGPPMASYDGRSMRLRAGYSPDYKKATLVHELGHLLSFALPRTAALDDHRLLYLFLYDVWTDLYGRAFADRMVAIERRIPGRYDYDAAWTWALAMTREERQARLRALRALRGPLVEGQRQKSRRSRRVSLSC
jgi:hypothetical protein